MIYAWFFTEETKSEPAFKFKTYTIYLVITKCRESWDKLPADLGFLIAVFDALDASY